MTADDLTDALRACAAGLYRLEAGVALLIANGTFLHRDDFTSRFIDHGTGNGTAMAAIDWDAAVTAWPAGAFPAPAANGVLSCCRPASPPGSPSTSAMPSPASMTTTSQGWSPRSFMPEENDPRPADIDDRF